MPTGKLFLSGIQCFLVVLFLSIWGDIWALYGFQDFALKNAYRKVFLSRIQRFHVILFSSIRGDVIFGRSMAFTDDLWRFSEVEALVGK